VSLELALTTQSNWVQIYSESRNAVFIDDNYFKPIPAFEIGIRLSTPVIAIQATSTTARGWWRSAGNLYQRFQIGSGGTANPLPQVDARRVWVPLNRAKLIQFNLYQPEYEIVYVPPDWFQSVQFRLWAYTGPVVETTLARFDLVDADLDQIIAKIDANN
jgi:hypothetical protein